jgi:hypothetical protein
MTQTSDPGALSGALAGVGFVGGVAAAMTLSDAPYPRPGATVTDVQRYFSDNAGPARISVAGQLVSAAALARFTGSVVRLASRPAVRAAAIGGGVLATTSLVTSAVASAALTGKPGEQESTARSLHKLVFLAGGPVHCVGLGMLVGALGMAGIQTGQLPRRLSVAGLTAAGAALLAPATLAAKPAMVVIPLSRLAALVVSGIAGARLARRSG